MSRTPRSVIAVVLLVAALAGCGADQAVRAGAAATVGGERISTEALADSVEAVLATEAGAMLASDRPALQRAVLARLIRSELLAVAAEREGVSVDPGAVDAELAALVEEGGGQEAVDASAAQGGIAPGELRSAVEDFLLQQALAVALSGDQEVPAEQIQAAYDADPSYDVAVASHILVADEALAQDLFAQLQADPSRFEELAMANGTDGSAQAGGDLGAIERGQTVPQFEQALFDLEVGELGLATTEFGFHVILLRDRQTVPLEDVEDELRTAIQAESGTAVSSGYLAALAAELGIDVSPRFGAWDQTELDVVAPVADPERDAVTPAPGDAPAGGAPTPSLPAG